MKRLLTIVGLCVLLAGCSVSFNEDPQPVVVVIATETPTETPWPSSTPEPTRTPFPPTATATSTPTNTPTSTMTSGQVTETAIAKVTKTAALGETVEAAHTSIANSKTATAESDD